MTIKVDLLPTERKRFTFDPMMGFLLVIIIICTVGFVIYGSKLQNNIEKEKGEVAAIETEIAEIEKSIPQIDQLKTDIAKLKAEIKVIEGLRYDPVRYGNLLAEVSRVLPENVWISNLSIEPGTQTISMTGTAAAMGGRLPLHTVASLLEKIQASTILKDAVLGATTQVKTNPTGLLGFSFKVDVQYSPDAAVGLAEPEPAAAEGEPAEEGAEAPIEAAPGGAEAPASGT